MVTIFSFDHMTGENQEYAELLMLSVWPCWASSLHPFSRGFFAERERVCISSPAFFVRVKHAPGMDLWQKGLEHHGRAFKRT